MSDAARSPRPPKRQRFLVDHRLQLAVTAQLLGVLFGVGLLYALGLLVLPGDRLDGLTGDEARQVFLRANAIYFALGAAILGVVSILLTHRVAGPALVLERSVQALRRGEYGQRFSLRRRDYLKGLARALAGLHDDLEARDRDVEALLACVREGDLDGAREVADRLARGHKPPDAADEPAAQPETETTPA